MQLLYPWGLLALVLIPVLLLIHLLRVPGRSKRVSFLPLWDKVLPTSSLSQGSRKRRINLLFLLEALIVCLLALALAKTAVRWTGQPPSVALVLDLTASMQARNPEGSTRWERTQARAQELLAHLDGPDPVTLLLCRGPQDVEAQRLTVRQARDLITRLTPGMHVGSGDELLERIVIPNAERYDAVFFVTDSLSAESAGSVPPSVHCTTVGQACENVGITQWSSRTVGDGTVEVFLGLLNADSTTRTGRVRLSQGNVALGEKPFRIESGRTADLVFAFKPNDRTDELLSEVILEDGGDGFEADDKVLAVPVRLRVTFLGEPSPTLRKFFLKTFPDTVELIGLPGRSPPDLLVLHRNTTLPSLSSAFLVTDPQKAGGEDVVPGERQSVATGATVTGGDDILLEAVDPRGIRFQHYRPLQVSEPFKPFLWLEDDVIGAVAKDASGKPRVVLGFSPEEGWGKDASFVVFMVNLMRELTGTGRPPDEPYAPETPALLSAAESLLPAESLTLKTAPATFPEQALRSAWEPVASLLVMMVAALLFLWWCWPR